MNHTKVEYWIGCSFFFSPHYQTQVIEFDKKTSKVRLALRVGSEPDFKDVIANYDQLSVCYLTEHIVVQKLGISSYLLNRITGDLFVNESEEQSRSKGTNIGLKIKYSSRNKEVWPVFCSVLLSHIIL